MEHKIAKSYGIIPIFKDGTKYNILIVQNSKGGHWGLPKGTPENSELPMQTATRELQEETGIKEKDIQVQENPVFLERYSFEQNGVVYDKTNTYYIGFVEAMTVGVDLGGRRIIKKKTLEEAKEKLTHEEHIKVVEGLEIYLNA